MRSRHRRDGLAGGAGWAHGDGAHPGAQGSGAGWAHDGAQGGGGGWAHDGGAQGGGIGGGGLVWFSLLALVLLRCLVPVCPVAEFTLLMQFAA
jgi:hypothetical protein